MCVIKHIIIIKKNVNLHRKSNLSIRATPCKWNNQYTCKFSSFTELFATAIRFHTVNHAIASHYLVTFAISVEFIHRHSVVLTTCSEHQSLTTHWKKSSFINIIAKHVYNLRNFNKFTFLKCRTDRFGNSFFPSMINVLNNNWLAICMILHISHLFHLYIVT